MTGLGFNNRPTRNSIEALMAWNQEIVPRICQDCGDPFTGTRRRKFCERCLKDHKTERDRAYDLERCERRKEQRRR